MHHNTWNRPIPRGLCLVAAAAGIGLASAPVMAGGGSITVPVANPSFEEQVLPPGGIFFSPTPITGWTATATSGSDRGLWHFPENFGQDGNNVAFVGVANSMAQGLSHAIVANSTYTVGFLFELAPMTRRSSRHCRSPGSASSLLQGHLAPARGVGLLRSRKHRSSNKA
jgi:hypothetical protein